MTRFALIIGQQNAYLYRVRRGSATLQQATSLAGGTPQTWLAVEIGQGDRCTVLTDFLDEAYALSPLPPMWWPPAREQLLARRLNNQYRGAELRAAIVPQGDSWRPPAMASLFSLGQGDTVNRWVLALEQLKARVEGVWTFASLVAVAHLGAKQAAGKTTLLVMETPSGLRQVAVHGGAPVFSRLASLAEEVEGIGFQGACDETQRTAQYLLSQNWVSSAAQPIETHLWLSQLVAAPITLPSRVGALNVVAVHQALDAYAVTLSSTGRLPASQQLLPPKSLQRWRAHQLGQGALLATSGALAAALIWGGFSAREVLDLRAHTRSQDAEAASIDGTARSEVMQAKGDVNQAALAEASVASWRTAVGNQPDQRAALAHLAQALASVPEAALTSIRWQVKDPLTGPAPASSPSEAVSCVAPVAGASQSAPAETAGAATNVPQVLAVLRFKGELPPELTPRAAIDLQDRLTMALKHPRWRVTVMQPAFELNPDKAQVGALGTPTQRPLDLCMEWLAQ